jgi:hypothetical protein
MPKYICVTKCFHKDKLWEEGEQMTVPESSDYKPPHHFKLIEGDNPKIKEPEIPVDDEQDIENIRSDFDKLGAAYDRRWCKQRLENELILARKNRGE